MFFIVTVSAAVGTLLCSANVNDRGAPAAIGSLTLIAILTFMGGCVAVLVSALIGGAGYMKHQEPRCYVRIAVTSWRCQGLDYPLPPIRLPRT